MRETTAFSGFMFGPLWKCFSELHFGSGAQSCLEGTSETNIQSGIVCIWTVLGDIMSLRITQPAPYGGTRGRISIVQHQEMLSFSLIVVFAFFSFFFFFFSFFLFFFLRYNINLVFFLALTAGSLKPLCGPPF